ncbi:serum paraoxonase/arylesterase [Crepidotus variabilis]|uniref:Serum paraoxonase/arylesterase n=1 Tax=Crepidotus variabilis TaxID=179855 RepID=A0A9P6EBV4_9AGAR|nr:serum paraoxonase/arylesterase [Crepidotus variabilis]
MGLQSVFNILVVLAAISGGFWQFYLQPKFVQFGRYRVVEPINNKRCIAVPELSACEKLVLHQPSGIVYLACSTPSSRTHWTPAVNRFNVTGASFNDYIATYDPKSSKITRLKMFNFNSERGFSSHGMDVVPSATSADELFVYLINHRAPLGASAYDVGADSAVEIFRTALGSDILTHLQTVEDSTIVTPNDIVGESDGKSFYFTNDYGEKVGWKRHLDIWAGRKSTSVGHCHVTDGCHLAISGLQGSNGIAMAENRTFYVANGLVGGITILEEQMDHTLVITDSISIDRGVDNLSVDSGGHVWAASIPQAMKTVFEHFEDPTIPAPSSVHHFSINTNPQEIPYGIKYKADKVFEDDGSFVSGSTSAAFDTERKLLFLTGLCSPHLTICNM